MTVHFSWGLVRWQPGDAPRHDRCCYCGAPIDDDHVPLILWKLDTSDTAIFCEACEALAMPTILRQMKVQPCRPTTKH